MRAYCTCSHSCVIECGLHLSYKPLEILLELDLSLLILLQLVRKMSMLSIKSQWDMGHEAIRRFVRRNCMAGQQIAEVDRMRLER